MSRSVLIKLEDFCSLFVSVIIKKSIPKCIGCSFKFILKAGVEVSIVNAPRIQITDQL
jgi:hypothetical protein